MRISPVYLLLLLVCRPDRAIAIAYWYVTRRKLRARLQLAEAISKLPFAYSRWIEASGQSDLEALKHGEPAKSVRMSIHLHVANANELSAMRSAIGSILRQSHCDWHLFITSSNGELPVRQSDPRISCVKGNFASQMDGMVAVLDDILDPDGAHSLIVPMSVKIRLPKHALAAYAAQAHGLEGGRLPILFGDQDEVRPLGHARNPWLKPEWDAEMFLSQDYVTAACALPAAAVRAGIADRAKAPASLFELVLRLALQAGWPIVHIPRVTARTEVDGWSKHSVERIDALERWAADEEGVKLASGSFGTVQIIWPLPSNKPKVSIIVPTRDRVELLRTCVDGLLKDTAYPNFEVIVADNGSQEPETLSYLDEISCDGRVRIVSWPHPFNYSAINNYAVSLAKGQFICLLNNDIEIVAPDWLTELMRHALRPGVGAVGAKLLYPDRTIQHAGVVIGMGNAAGHAHRGLPDGEAGYFAQAHITRGASAVTGACLVLSKDHFDAVGGLDETDLAVAYNDVDLCLKLERMALRNVYVPNSVLIHHESKSRGQDFAPENLKRYMQELGVFQKRWQSQGYLDPWFHPHLNSAREAYELRLVGFQDSQFVRDVMHTPDGTALFGQDD